MQISGLNKAYDVMKDLGLRQADVRVRVLAIVVDPDLHWECGSGSESWRSKMTHKEKNFMFCSTILG
jgi:hypothetical protein